MPINNQKRHVKMFMLAFAMWVWLMAMLNIEYYGLAQVPNFMYCLFGIVFIFVLFKIVQFLFSELKPFFIELKRLFGLD